MEEFLRQNYYLITHCVEILAAVTGVLLYNKYKHTAAKYFIWFLVYLTLCDFILGYTHYIKDNGFFSFLEGTVLEKNYWWATLFWKIGAIVFFAFYFYNIIKTAYFKRIIKLLGYSFFSFSCVYILLNWSAFFIRFFPIISVLGAIVILVCVTLYFIEILKTDILLSFYTSLNFYISSTILIWWLIITPLVFYDLYFSNADWNFILLKWQIYLFANIFMYCTFTLALILSKPETEQV